MRGRHIRTITSPRHRRSPRAADPFPSALCRIIDGGAVTPHRVTPHRGTRPARATWLPPSRYLWARLACSCSHQADAWETKRGATYGVNEDQPWACHLACHSARYRHRGAAVVCWSEILLHGARASSTGLSPCGFRHGRFDSSIDPARLDRARCAPGCGDFSSHLARTTPRDQHGRARTKPSTRPAPGVT